MPQPLYPAGEGWVSVLYIQLSSLPSCNKALTMTYMAAEPRCCLSSPSSLPVASC
jgi:hypothetical protein